MLSWTSHSPHCQVQTGACLSHPHTLCGHSWTEPQRSELLACWTQCPWMSRGWMSHYIDETHWIRYIDPCPFSLQSEVSLSRHCLMAWDHADLQTNRLLRVSQILNMHLKFLFNRAPLTKAAYKEICYQSDLFPHFNLFLRKCSLECPIQKNGIEITTSSPEKKCGNLNWYTAHTFVSP